MSETNDTRTVYIVGQPNAGKSSVFNLLTGGQAHVGNWAGVTVERKSGFLRIPGKPVIEIVDLPGAYGLNADTIEEGVTRDALVSGGCDVVLNVVDSTTLERQLFLTIQALALGRPTVIALTMTDELRESGKEVDLDRLSELLGVPCVRVNGRTGAGIDALRDVLSASILPSACPDGASFLPPSLAVPLAALAERLSASGAVPEKDARFFALFLALSDGKASFSASNEAISAAFKAFRDSLVQSSGRSRAIDAVHGAAKGLAAEVVTKETNLLPLRSRISSALDSVALSPVFGIPLFILVLFGVFSATFSFGEIAASWLETLFSAFQDSCRAIPVPWLASLLADGAIAGAGSVMALAPYVFIMFLLLSFLEDSGYMARVAFVTDRFMHRLGLHGKAFIPLVMGFGCNVPAIMAARTLESERDRIKVALMVPFMSCSARLPVYVVISGAFFGAYAAYVVLALYLGGMVAGVLSAMIVSKTALKGSSPGLVMELPPYRLPVPRSLLINTWLKTKGYAAKAGTVILAASVVLWALSYFPLGTEYGGETSLLGLLGRLLAPAFSPLGFDYRMTTGLVVGFAAKELVLSSLAVFSGSADLSSALLSMMTPSVALGYLCFILLYTPCLATVAVMKSETNSTKWTAISVAYGLVLAWAVAFAVRLAASFFMP